MDAAYLEQREVNSISYRMRQTVQAAGGLSRFGAAGDEGRLLVDGRFSTNGLELPTGYFGQTNDDERHFCEHDDGLVLRQLSGPKKAPWHF